jgi:hypothetical protein
MHELHEKFIENLAETLTGKEHLEDPHGRLEDNIFFYYYLVGRD